MRSGPFPVPAAWKNNEAATASSIHHQARPYYYSPASTTRPSMSAVASPGCRGSSTTTTTTMARPPPSTASSGGGGRGGGGQQQRPGRLRACMQRIPLCTTLVTIACLALQLCVLLLHWDIGQYAISPAAVLDDKQYLRLITAPYFHVNALHIIMNMLSFVGIGAYLEMQQGTLYLFMTIAYATVITNVVYIGICEILLQATKNMHWYYYSSIGFSGIIFQLAVLETYTAPPGSTRNIFGFCNVPAKLYPWALLIIIQIVMPRISFVGHLSGLLVGILQAYGFFGFLFPPRAWVNRLEASAVCSPLVRCGQYILAPEASARDQNALCALFARCCCGGGGGGGGGGSGSNGGGGGLFGSPRRRAQRNFGGGTTGTVASPSSPGTRLGGGRGGGVGAPVVASAPVAVATSVPVPGVKESPHSRAAGADGQGWRRIEDHDVYEGEEAGDLEGGYHQQYQQGGGGLQGGDGSGDAGGQRRIVL